ncbi:hypothetical protein D3C78_1179850 [compost metagenome]
MLLVEAKEGGESGHRLAFGLQGVLRCTAILVAEGDAADQDVVFRHRHMLAHHLVIPGERRLRTGVQALAAGGEHDVLDEHADVHVAADVEPAVEADQQADRRIEELEVAQVLAFACRQVLAGDAEGVVEVEADGAAAAQVGFEPVVRVVAVLGAVFPGLFLCSLLDVVAQRLLGAAGQHMYVPRLHIAAAGGSRSHLEDVFDHLLRNVVGQEATDRLAGADGGIDMHKRFSEGDWAIVPEWVAEFLCIDDIPAELASIVDTRLARRLARAA